MAAPIAMVPKPTADAQARASAVAILQKTLKEAEAGSVLECIVVTKDSDGMWTHRTTPTLSVREEIGAIECLKWDRIHRTQN